MYLKVQLRKLRSREEIIPSISLKGSAEGLFRHVTPNWKFQMSSLNHYSEEKTNRTVDFNKSCPCHS